MPKKEYLSDTAKKVAKKDAFRMTGGKAPKGFKKDGSETKPSKPKNDEQAQAERYAKNVRND